MSQTIKLVLTNGKAVSPCFVKKEPIACLDEFARIRDMALDFLVTKDEITEGTGFTEYSHRLREQLGESEAIAIPEKLQKVVLVPEFRSKSLKEFKNGAILLIVNTKTKEITVL